MTRMKKNTLRISSLVLCMTAMGCGVSNELSRAPVVGIVQDHQVPILIRATSEGTARIEYKKSDVDESAFTSWGTLSSDNDLSTSVTLGQIEADTGYIYRVEFEQQAYSEWFSFRSFPAAGEPGKFSFMFSSCMRETYKDYNIFEQVERFSPTFIALLGDQMYGDYDGDLNRLEEYLSDDGQRSTLIEEGEIVLDDNSILEAFRSKYDRIFDQNYQHMASRFPMVATWDDHDYGDDNSDATYPYKDEAKKVFKENYPDYAYEDEDGGLYYRFSISDVDVFVLDSRWYRVPMQDSEGAEKKMLGDRQLEWLLTGLRESQASVKLVLSSVSLNDYGGDTSSGRSGYDSWMGYKYERDLFLSFVKDNDISGVLVFSGDQHYPSAHILNWDAPLTEVSRSDKAIEYSLSDLGSAVFDFSASPLNYKKAAGHLLIPENQTNPAFSHELFRPDWAIPSEPVEGAPLVIGSVFGLVEVDTESSSKNVSVGFYELDAETEEIGEIYRVTIGF